MSRIVLILIYFLIVFRLQAGDSLSTRPKKVLLDVSVARAGQIFSHYKSPFISYPTKIDCSVSDWMEYKLKATCFILQSVSKKQAVHSFGPGIGCGLLQFTFKEHIYQDPYTSHMYSSSYTFSPSTIITRKTGALFNGFLNYSVFRKRIMLVHQLGVNIAVFSSRTHSHGYDETTTSNGMTLYQDSVNHPYSVHYYTESSSSHYTNHVTFWNFANLYYSFDLGVRIGRFLPHLGLEVTYHPNNASVTSDQIIEVNCPDAVYAKLIGGLSYRF